MTLDRKTHDTLQRRADPLADHCIAEIVGSWATNSIEQNANQWNIIEQLNREIMQWRDNDGLKNWQSESLPPHVVHALQNYLQHAQQLPDWADQDKIRRAEELFYEYGLLSCMMLFCASLPQCYVLPNLSDVLHVAGQLEAHTEYRIRMTAAMIFPVMMHGGLTEPQGKGVAQVLKVRLIHAMIRNLIMRGEPSGTASLLQSENRTLPPLEEPCPSQQLHRRLFAHGWDPARLGLPCNQIELAYTLLTFNYIFLAGLRKIGVHLTKDDEQAYLHTWNVIGHLLGIERQLMGEEMDEAERMFDAIQQFGTKQQVTPDPRPSLGNALIDTMKNAIPFAVLKYLPAKLTRYLCGRKASRELAIERVPFLYSLMFGIGLGIIRALDAMLRYFDRDLSIFGMLSRILGYRLLSELLLSQTRPLKLPEHTLNDIRMMTTHWHDNKRGPRWTQTLEKRWTRDKQ